MKEDFMHPGGGPNSNFILFMLVSVLGAIIFFEKTKALSKEINYQDFVNLHLVKNDVAMITLSENKDNSSFKFKATITTTNGAKYHIVLPQVENFLYRLDQTQREMGRDPANFVPVKYGSGMEEEVNPLWMNAFLLAFGSLLFSIIRSRHKKG